MPRKAKELSALEVSRLKKEGHYFIGGVSGLALRVSNTGARSWVLRVMIGGKRRDMGLGGYPDVPLALARDKARAAREKIGQGIDPIDDARQAKSTLAASRASAVNFSEAAKSYIKAKEPEWKNAKHATQWANTLETYAEPIIGNLLVRDINQSHILRVLEPIWTTKTETATRLRGRIECVLDWATVRGYRQGDNPARWRGHLDKLLPKPSKISTTEHHAALPYEEMGEFMAELRKVHGQGAKALQFAILTACRSGEVRGATWSEINIDEATWIIPPQRMKAAREHRVPLSEAALQILRAQPKVDGCDLVFPSTKGTQLSDMTLTGVLRRMKQTCTAHGFRSSFRDWAAERTNYPREVAEMALAHTIEDKVEAAYRRGDLFQKRRLMMDHWAEFCDTIAVAGEVVPLNQKQIWA